MYNRYICIAPTDLMLPLTFAMPSSTLAVSQLCGSRGDDGTRENVALTRLTHLHSQLHNNDIFV